MRFLVLTFIILLFLVTSSVSAVIAGPHLTLTPPSSSFSVGTSFVVIVGVDSGTEKSSAVDAWGTFDASKLEIVLISPSNTPAFEMDLSSSFDNATGKFQISAASKSSSSYEDAVIKGELAKVAFRPKSAGVVSMNFNCQSGSTIDSNIFKSTGVDVIDCATNQSGSYTITGTTVAGTGTTTTTVTNNNTTNNNATPTVRPNTTATELPKTGGIASTLGLAVFGGMSILGALFLRLL